MTGCDKPRDGDCGKPPCDDGDCDKPPCDDRDCDKPPCDRDCDKD